MGIIANRNLDSESRLDDVEAELVAPPPRQNVSVGGESYLKAYGKQKGVLELLGYKALRPGQDRAVMSLLMKRDTILLLPTGGGKSLVYIVPTLCHNWRCVIFSPLISLMQDQLEALLRYDLAGGQISSGQGKAENDGYLRSWEAGDLQFLLVSPERQNDKDFMLVMRKRPPNLVVIDEAHAASQWGHNFRPAYGRIGGFVSAINPDTVLCLTATATPDVEADIRTIMGIPNATRVVYYPPRKNLQLSSRTYRNNHEILNLITRSPGSTIVYCTTKKHCEELYHDIGQDIEGGSLVYHGGMDMGSRATNQELFMTNQVRVMFCTNAFGMGVNKPDIRNVFHRDIPASVEAYTQESGRAGRDGLPSQCVLFCDPQSISTSRWMIAQEFPERYVVERVFHHLQKIKDAKGVVVQTVTQIAAGVNLDDRPVGSALAILDVAKVVKRSRDEESPARVVLVKDTHVDPAMQKYLDTAKKIGYEVKGAYEFRLSLFVQQTGIKIKKATETFKLLDTNGYIQFQAPFVGKTTTVIGDLKLVDFAKLKLRYEDKLRKLDEVQAYAGTPDEKKHDFLQRYFIPGDPP